jgi:anti-sigma factor RsiW
MNITRDVIVDLLPLYAAGEASADTRDLVESYIKQDPSLTALLRELQEGDHASAVAAADLSPSLERAAVNRTRAVIRRRSWTLGLAIFFTLLPLTFGFSGGRITFFMLRDEPGSVLFWISAAYLWWKHVRLTRELTTTGL